MAGLNMILFYCSFEFLSRILKPVEMNKMQINQKIIYFRRYTLICWFSCIFSVLNKRCCYCPVLIDEDQIVNHLILYESQCLISEKAIRIPFKAVRNVDVFGQEVYIYTFENRAMYNKVENDTLCYAIQTSGSTREPKIVNVPYSCVLPNIESLR